MVRLPVMRFLPLIAVFLSTAAVFAADPTPSAYPLITCIVSGDKLGAMGNPVALNYQGTEIRFCCHDCIESFKQDPAKYLAKLKTSTSHP